METAAYVVTENAPPRVAGRPVQPGQVLALTEAEALYEALTGAIVPRPAEAEPTRRQGKGAATASPAATATPAPDGEA